MLQKLRGSTLLSRHLPFRNPLSQLEMFNRIYFTMWEKNKKVVLSLPGFEPGTFGLEVQRAIHCATGTLSALEKLEIHSNLVA